MQGRYEGADGIRGLACLIVICVHGSAFFFPDTGHYLAGTGKIGVWLFFVLSAFLLTSKFIRSGFAARLVVGYAVGRFFRIIPLFCLVVLAYYSLGLMGIVTGDDLLKALTFASGYGHLWTVPAEFKFYLILPFMAYAIIFSYKKFGVWHSIGTSLVMIAVQQLLWPYWITPENSIETRWYLSSFTVGIICSVLHYQFRDKLNDKTADVAGVTVMVLIFLSFPYMRNILFGMPIDKWLMDKSLFLSLCWSLFILALADGKGYCGIVLKSFFLRRIGEWSFSIYLIHIMIYGFVSYGRSPTLLLTLLAIASSVLVGAGMFYMFEKPLDSFRHKIQKRILSKG